MVTVKQIVGMTVFGLSTTAGGYMLGTTHRPQRQLPRSPARGPEPLVRAWFYGGDWYVDQLVVDRLRAAGRKYTPTSSGIDREAGGWEWFDFMTFPFGVLRAPPGDVDARTPPLEGQRGALFAVNATDFQGKHLRDLDDLFAQLEILGVLEYMDLKGRTSRGGAPWTKAGSSARSSPR